MPKTITRSPFKFLDSYQKEDKEIFFGREAETEELYDRVFETNLILLYGASGTGKTSLINCGLGNKFDTADWHPIFIRRKDNILDSFQKEIDRLAVKEMDKDASIAKKLRSLYLDYFKPIYLIFDQFEELFILGSLEEQTAFFELLNDILIAGLQCKVLISMREEYIAFLSDYERIVPTLFDNRQRIEKMHPSDIRDVIAGTAEAFNIKMIDPETTLDKMIENLKDKRAGIDLANLQVYLDRLYKKDVERKGSETGEITFDPPLIDAAGKLEDVLADFLEEQIFIIDRELEQQKGIKDKGIPMDILFALVTDNGTKQAITLENIKENLKKRKGIEPAIVDFCIERFQDMRIVRELTE